MDDDVSASRKLSDGESSSLRSLLLGRLSVPASGPGADQAEEDASDLLDYAFAMIANGKNVGYVVQEVRPERGGVPDANL